jgi:hypothetical protein
VTGRERARDARWPVGLRVQAVPDGDKGTLVRVVHGRSPGSTYAIVAWDTGWSGRVSLTQLLRLDDEAKS